MRVKNFSEVRSSISELKSTHICSVIYCIFAVFVFFGPMIWIPIAASMLFLFLEKKSYAIVSSSIKVLVLAVCVQIFTQIITFVMFFNTHNFIFSSYDSKLFMEHLLIIILYGIFFASAGFCLYQAFLAFINKTLTINPLEKVSKELGEKFKKNELS